MGSIRLGWWNLQNLFDTDDDPISADLEFTVAKGWTPEVYAAKLANLAVAINELHDGQGPELFGVCEVEGDASFRALLEDREPASQARRRSGGNLGSPRHRHLGGL